MTFNEKCKILAHEDAAPGYRTLVFSAPQIAAAVVPGQFVHVKVPRLDDAALRRPFSVFDADAEAGTLTVLYKIVGKGTEALAKESVGADVEVIGPLGYGFPVRCGGVPILVGGGYGVAPLYFLAKRLLEAGVAEKPVLFVGGRTKDDLLAVERFVELGIEVRTATNDGSEGVKGFVTEPLDAELVKLRGAGKGFELFTCGPDGLLKAVSDRALSTGSKGWISMDRHMICGVGACFACIQKLKRPNGEVWNARCCVNGPVFKAEEIVW
jgi:dihydroorotate dehydrogenase electron transfer subunit